jgi:hypothetical protein
MMRLLTKAGCLAAGALCAAGFIAWPGCATPPLPASRTPLSIHKRSEFKWKKDAHPSRDEIVAKLGQPDEYFADLQVSCYKLNRLKQRTLYLFLGILPIGWAREGDGLEAAMIQFDEHDRAQRVGIKVFDSGGWSEYPTARANVSREDQRTMRIAAQAWVNEAAKGGAKH